MTELSAQDKADIDEAKAFEPASKRSPSFEAKKQKRLHRKLAEDERLKYACDEDQAYTMWLANELPSMSKLRKVLYGFYNGKGKIPSASTLNNWKQYGNWAKRAENDRDIIADTVNAFFKEASVEGVIDTMKALGIIGDALAMRGLEMLKSGFKIKTFADLDRSVVIIDRITKLRELIAGNPTSRHEERRILADMPTDELVAAITQAQKEAMAPQGPRPLDPPDDFMPEQPDNDDDVDAGRSTFTNGNAKQS